MNTTQLVLVAIAAIALPACTTQAALPTVADAATAIQVARCGDPVPVVDGASAWTVEGFGGPDAQVFVTRRQPTAPCRLSVGAQARTARLDALR